ncbi:DUF1353 domain-containing protein [Pelagibacterium halotolerans]|uniref:DUF1353 domain-containing protein n=1 Tax=Pelagibacterium halotolerans TaxID=531813 RepID=UPI00384C29A5
MRFTDPVHLMPAPGTGKYVLVQPVRYQVGFMGSKVTITVPDGFMTDLASIPRLLWSLLPPHDPDYAAAAVLHDYLYVWKDGAFTRVVADAIFYEAMRILGVPAWKAVIMYLAVRFANNWTVSTTEPETVARVPTPGVPPAME